jgi:glyoxylase-like metal-dependent hydrolase (beta-lactamase superfamily II)
MTITWRHFPAGEHGFFRAPVLLAGASEAILIDGGFTFADGRKVVDAIRASGKRLTTVYVSQSDPDYYFSLAPIRAAFPGARFIAAEAAVAAIRANVQKKLDTWGPQLKDNGPQTLAEVVFPVVFNDRTLELEGETIEIVQAAGQPNARTLWVPSLRALFGGVLVFAGVHVWVADTASREQRETWLRNLDALAALGPSVVVPGHLAEGAALDASAIAYTRDYLLAFEEELAKARDSAALIGAMKQRYPKAGMGVALDIGAKVAKGEMKWG